MNMSPYISRGRDKLGKFYDNGQVHAMKALEVIQSQSQSFISSKMKHNFKQPLLRAGQISVENASQVFINEFQYPS